MSLLEGSALEEFNAVANKNFREQGIAFLNAYWNEVEDQADFIFEVAYAHFRMAEMVRPVLPLSISLRLKVVDVLMCTARGRYLFGASVRRRDQVE